MPINNDYIGNPIECFNTCLYIASNTNEHISTVFTQILLQVSDCLGQDSMDSALPKIQSRVQKKSTFIYQGSSEIILSTRHVFWVILQNRGIGNFKHCRKSLWSKLARSRNSRTSTYWEAFTSGPSGRFQGYCW